jgi:hypothetical protein
MARLAWDIYGAIGLHRAGTRTMQGDETIMALSAAHSVSKQTETGLKPRTCPVCGRALRTAGTRRWICEQGHTVAHYPEYADAAHREELGRDEDGSDALIPRPAVLTQQHEARLAEQSDIPLPAREDIVAAKAEWERKRRRERQRRWRARKRAGLV